MFKRLISRVKNAFRAFARETVSLDDARLLELLGIDPDEVNVRGAKALREATVYACVRILSEAVAKLPCKMYREGSKGTEKALDHHVYPRLKLRPNPYMTAYDMFKAVEAQKQLHGNAYIAPEIIGSGPNRGKIRWLWPLDAARVEVWVDDKGIISSQKQLWYIVRTNGEERKLGPDEIIHLKAMTLDGLVGVSPLHYLRWLVEAGASGTKHVREFFRQGLQAKGLIHYTGDLSPEAEETFRMRFERMAAGLKAAHRVALLPIGYQFQPLQISMVDAQFLETAQLTIRQLAAAFGVKMHQLNELTRATHTNIEEQQREFYADTLQAILVSYEQEMTYKLFTPSEVEAGYHIRFNVDSILRADLLKRYSAYRLGVQGSVLAPNEARALEELPPKPGGDDLLANRAMAPITMLGELPPGQPGKGTGGEKS